jgi:predicted  nucleic acid-binding Zn-ribbon protein
MTTKQKKLNVDAKTTLDTLHNIQLNKLNDNENELNILIQEKKSLEDQVKNVEINNNYSIAYECQIDQIENKLKILNNEIETRKNKNEIFDYYLNTGDILYKYYDIQEQIQDGTLPKKQINKKKLGGIFDVLNKAAKNEGIEEKNEEEIFEFTSRDKLLEEYLKKVHPDSVKSSNSLLNDTYGECINCEKEMVFSPNEAVFTCMECGHQEFILIDSDKPSYKDPPREASYFAYKRINHFNEWLAQFQAKESTEIPQEVFDLILVELKKERILDTKKIKQTKIREILKKLKLNKYYEHVPHIINRINGENAPIMSREVEEKLRFMFKEIQPSFHKHCPADRNNFLSYSYVLYKFCELLELDHLLDCFTLHKDPNKLMENDEIWRKICIYLNWEFINSFK